jgi:hypothetical protein
MKKTTTVVEEGIEVGRIMPPTQDSHILIPGTSECAGKVAEGIKVTNHLFLR